MPSLREQREKKSERVNDMGRYNSSLKMWPRGRDQAGSIIRDAVATVVELWEDDLDEKWHTDDMLHSRNSVNSIEKYTEGDLCVSLTRQIPSFGFFFPTHALWIVIDMITATT